MKIGTCEFNGWKCDVIKHQYSNSRIALQLIASENQPDMDTEKGEPIAVATINIPEVSLGTNEVIIKDYSENAGILESLVKANIVKETGRMIQTGFVTCPVCTYIDNIKKG